MCYFNPCVTQCKLFAPRKLLNEAISIITRNFIPLIFTKYAVVRDVRADSVRLLPLLHLLVYYYFVAL